jgi:hypothetical protein
LGITFTGMQEREGETPLPMFSDPETGTSFVSPAGKTIDEALKSERQRFNKAAVDATEKAKTETIAAKTETIAAKGEKKPQSLFATVKAAGGLDPAKLRVDHNFQEDVVRHGLMGTTKKGGRALDDLAGELIGKGDIPENNTNMADGDYLLDLMQKERRQKVTDLETTVDKAEKDAIIQLTKEWKDEGLSDDEIKSRFGELQTDSEKEAVDQALKNLNAEARRDFDEFFPAETDEPVRKPATTKETTDIVAEAKQPWQMTKTEYDATLSEVTPKEGTGKPTETTPAVKPEGGIDFSIYNPQKSSDAFYHSDLKNGYVIRSDKGSAWAWYDKNGDLLETGKDWSTKPTEEQLSKWSWYAKRAATSWLNTVPNKVYIRFGDLPKEGVSRHWEHGGKEKGISVYTGKKDISSDSIIFDPTAGRGGFPEIPAAAGIRTQEGAPIYLVEGRRVGYGSDNEPVLKDVKMLTKLKQSEEGGYIRDLPNPSRSPEAGEHKSIVEQALKEGKQVPSEVLKDYPELIPSEADQLPDNELFNTAKLFSLSGEQPFVKKEMRPGMEKKGERLLDVDKASVDELNERKKAHFSIGQDYDPGRKMTKEEIDAYNREFKEWNKVYSRRLKTVRPEIQRIVERDSGGQVRAEDIRIPSKLTPKHRRIVEEATGNGLDLIFYDGVDTASGIGGFVNADKLGRIYINSNVPDLESVVRHEQIHSLIQTYPEKYNTLLERIEPEIADINKFKDNINEKRQSAGFEPIDDAEALQELTANLAINKGWEWIKDKAKVQKELETFVKRDEPKGLLKDETGSAAMDLLAPGFEFGRDVVKGIKSLVLPTAATPEHLAAAVVLGKKLGSMHRDAESAAIGFEKDSKMFTKMGVYNPDIPLDQNPGVKFMSDMSQGRKMASEMQAVADRVTAAFEDRKRKLERAGAPLKSVRENYFPGMWQDETEAVAFLAKRPFKGGESFRKAKVFDDIMDGIDAGLKPISNNPLDLVKLKLAEMDRSIMANRAIQEWKEKGDIMFLRSGKETPAGFARINDKYGTVYGPPEMVTQEYADRNIWDALSKTAENIKTRHERKATAGSGKLGYYSKLEGIVTQANTELGVLSHEIGHALDDRYNLWDKIVTKAEGVGAKGTVTKTASAKQRGVIQKELRNLADLTWEGQQPSKHFKDKVRGKKEKIAHILEAYAQAPERLRSVAPNVYESFETFIKTVPELEPLRDMQSGISYKEIQTKRNVGGYPVIGYWIAKEPVSDILNNYLSSSVYNNKYFGKPFKAYMASANTLNQTQLGVFSAFHAGFTESEVQMSAGANVIKDLYGLARGNRSIGQVGKTLLKYPVAMGMTPTEGARVVKEWRTPTMDVPTDVPINTLPASKGGRVAMITKAAELAGGGFKLETGLKTEQTEKMVQNWYGGEKIKASLRSPVALLELGAKPIMEWLVPRQKAGIFGELAGRIMEQNAGKTMDELTPQFRQAWNRVDARLGQVRYDRLFINNAAKNGLQAIVRAPGWTGGTIAEIGGVFKDTAKFFADWIKTGKAPEDIPDRVAYTASLLMSTAVANGLLTYAFTGDKPKGIDYWAFRTGGVDEQGRPERFVLPTYAKDIFAYYQNPTHTILAKTHPLIGLLADMYKNKDYYGVKVFNEDDNFILKQADKGKYAMKQFVPFWMRGAGKEAERGGGVVKTLQETPQKMVAPLFGVMPATSAYTRSDAEKLMTQFNIGKTGQEGRTREQADISETKRKTLTELRKGTDWENLPEDLKTKLDKLSEKKVKEIDKEADLSAFQASFRHLTADEAVKVWKVMKPEERDQVEDMYGKKIKAHAKNLTDEEYASFQKKLWDADRESVTKEWKGMTVDKLAAEAEDLTDFQKKDFAPIFKKKVMGAAGKIDEPTKKRYLNMIKELQE